MCTVSKDDYSSLVFLSRKLTVYRHNLDGLTYLSPQLHTITTTTHTLYIEEHSPTKKNVHN